MIFRQLFDEDTWTYTYLIGDTLSKEAVIIDPVLTHIDDYLALLEQHGLTLKYSLETHVHADHITASGPLRQRTGAETAVSQLCGAEAASVQMQGNEVFRFGNETIQVIPTPGHTPGSVSFLWRDRVFTGDALFIDGCGRSDFQGGDAGALYDGITQNLFTLPDETLVYPGHDYNGRWVSSIQQEKTHNPRLADKSREAFIDIMNHLDLPAPRLIKESVPANRRCGLTEDEWQEAMERPASAKTGDGNTPVSASGGVTPQALLAAAKAEINEIDVATAKQRMDAGDVRVVDVREADEYVAGALPGAIHLPRGVLEFKLGSVEALTDKSAPVLLYCRTGGRSAMATQSLQKLGYTAVVSMAGGYEAWVKM